MTSNPPSPGSVDYVVYMPSSNRATCIPIPVPAGAKVKDLIKKICEDRAFKRHVESEDVHLYKCRELPMEPETDDPGQERYTQVTEWLRVNGKKQMNAAFLLQKYFPSGPSRYDEEKIDVIAATDTILESRDILYALPDRRASKVTKERLSQVKSMSNFPSPSEGVKSEEKISGWANEASGVHYHRPTGNHGPPTLLFHPALAMLKHRLTHLDQIEEPSASDLEWAHRFLEVCGNGFRREALREGQLKAIIDALIGEAATWQEFLPGKTAKPDAVWGRKIRAILELKNVDGLYGNASLQALLAYVKVLLENEHEKCVVHTNCPVILIGIMGSRLEISTAIFTDGIYADKLLSEDLYIDAWQADTVLRLGRIFKAVSLGIAELKEYYEAFDDGLEMQTTVTHLYPSPLPIDDNISIPRLNYIGKLSHTGDLLNEDDKEAVHRERPYALYRAKMYPDGTDEEMDVVVKFTVQYHEEAHRLLADKQLAPVLHKFVPLVGGMYMVIMDHIEGTPLYKAQKPQDAERVYNDVERAVGLLHEQNLVFGDLRVQNIILKPSGEVMLIDFDWVGRHLQDKYPASWNISPGRWAPEVDRGVLMNKAHDLFMLDRKVKRRWS